MSLKRYKQKRNFGKTSEPKGNSRASKNEKSLQFVIQRHHARRLHYDFRLELDGALKSWAVPKGPSLDPKAKRLAVEVEDHPLDYASFEGEIPEGEYGAGQVIVWDKGVWEAIGDPRKGLKKGSLKFRLRGEKLNGEWALVRTRPGEKQPQWLLIKKKDDFARSENEYNILEERPESVLTKKPFTTIFPQLATLSSGPPKGQNWIHEIKFDGYRAICRIENGSTRFFTRSGLDWTDRFEALAKDASKIKVRSCTIDGEIIVPDRQGRSDFNLLQQALKNRRTKELVFYAFDLLELNGSDLKDLSLIERKKKLRKLLEGQSLRQVAYSDHWDGDGRRVLKEVCKMGLEGIISKNRNEPYHSGRSQSWMKSKCVLGQEFVVGGYTESDGALAFGSLLLGVNVPAQGLKYVGKVGTGFNQKTMIELKKALIDSAENRSPFFNLKKAKSVKWVNPNLVAEVEYRGWTREGLLRQASFKGLREDKSSKEVSLERPLGEEGAQEEILVKLSNPQKILISDANITKRDIWKYYEDIHDFILPYISNRPLALVRCPNGINKDCFFQKNLMQRNKTFLKEHDFVGPKGKKSKVIYIDNLNGLMELAQLGVLEIHTAGTHRLNILNPDLVVFDLDPGPEVSWKLVVKAARRLNEILSALGLTSFANLTGGKGIHIHVPVRPIYSWDQIKDFAQVVSAQMIEEEPDLYLANMSKAKRHKKIFIDIFRNNFGATFIAPYSTRAKSEGSVAFPLEWDELDKAKPNGISLLKAMEVIRKRRRDPWEGYHGIRQDILILKAAAA